MPLEPCGLFAWLRQELAAFHVPLRRNVDRDHVDFVARTSLGFGFDHHTLDTHESVGPPLAYMLARRTSFLKRSKLG